ETAHGQVVARRAILTLVVAVRRELDDPMLAPRSRERVRRGAVDLGVAAPALLVVHRAGVADTGDDETVPDARDRLGVAREPGDGADRAREEEKTVRIPPARPAQELRERGRERDAREVVVGERRMAAVRREEDL